MTDDKFLEEFMKLANENKRLNKQSRLCSRIAIIFSLLALAISIFAVMVIGSRTDENTDEEETAYGVLQEENLLFSELPELR